MNIVRAVWKKSVRIYLLYAFISTVLLYVLSFYSPIEADKVLMQTTNDEAALLINRLGSFDTRIHLLENASETLDIAYYTIHPGQASDIFFKQVLAAADRGVQVRLLLDGLFHNLRFSSRSLRSMFIQHPNIELRFYEPLDFIRPWTWQNRLHDKLILVDNTYVLTGGRNIGDKYYFDDVTYDPVFDIDILLKGDSSSSAALTYFETLWDSPYSIKQTPSFLIGFLSSKERNNEYFQYACSYKPSTSFPALIPIDAVQFVHNPVTRGSKNPKTLLMMLDFCSSASERIVLQSPYIIVNRAMKRHIPIFEQECTLITNSIVASPNYLAVSGYLNNRGCLEKKSTIKEYHGPGSIHAKTLLIDEDLFAVGTFNMDPRSSFLSTETMVFIQSPLLASELEQTMNTYKENHQNVPPVLLRKRLLITLVRLLIIPFTFLL